MTSLPFRAVTSVRSRSIKTGGSLNTVWFNVVKRNVLELEPLEPLHAHRGRPGCGTRQYSSMAEDMRDLDSMQAYSQMIHYCAKSRNLPVAMRWFEKMEAAGFKADVAAYNALLDACAASQNCEESARVLKEMRSVGIRPDPYSYAAAIQACERTADIAMGEQLFDIMRKEGVVPTEVVYNTMINLHSKADNYEGAERWYNELARMQQPRCDTYNTMISMYGNAKRLDDAMGWFNALREDPAVRPDSWTYSSIVDACVSAQDMDKAGSLFEEACENQDLISVPLFNSMINGHGKLHDIKAAKWMYDRLRSSLGRNTASFNAMMQAYANVGDIEGVATVRGDMRRRACREDSITFSILITAYANANKLQKAQEILQEMRDDGLKPNALNYTMMFKAFAHKHKVVRAEHFLKEMRESDTKPNQVHYNIMADIYARDRNYAGAVAVIREMIRDGLSPDQATFQAVVKAASRCSDLCAAEEWMRRVDQADGLLSKQMYYSVLSACAQVGDLFAADRIIESMWDAGFEPDVVAHTALIRVCGNRRDTAEAERRFATMHKDGIAPNEWTLTAMVNAFGNAGDKHGAERWFFELIRLGVEPGTVSFNELLRMWAEQGDPQRVHSWGRRLKATGKPDVVSYNLHLKSAVQVLDCELAKHYYDQIAKRNMVPTLASFREVVKPFARNGDHVTVKAYIREMGDKGMPKDIACTRALLSAYSNSRPQASMDAERIFRQHLHWFRNDKTALHCLRNAVGIEHFRSLQKELDLPVLQMPATAVQRSAPRLDVARAQVPSRTCEATTEFAQEESTEVVLARRESGRVGTRTFVVAKSPEVVSPAWMERGSSAKPTDSPSDTAEADTEKETCFKLAPEPPAVAPEVEIVRPTTVRQPSHPAFTIASVPKRSAISFEAG